MFVPSFFSDVGCCSQRLGWVHFHSSHVSVGAQPGALMRLQARTPCCDGFAKRTKAGKLGAWSYGTKYARFSVGT